MMKNWITISVSALTLCIFVLLVTAFKGESTQTPAPNRFLEKLTPQNATLLMVDYLTGFDAGLKTIDRNTYLNNVEALSKIGSIFKLPTIILGDEGGFRGDFYGAIGRNLPNGVRIERHTPSAWNEPKFVEQLKKIGRKKIILAGISLDNCTLHLVNDLLRNDYDVYVVVDCSGSDNELVETAAMMRMTQAGAIMTSWVSLASELMGDWASKEGPEIGKLYSEHSAWGGGVMRNMLDGNKK